MLAARMNGSLFRDAQRYAGDQCADITQVDIDMNGNRARGRGR
jgi:hypothetical protein